MKFIVDGSAISAHVKRLGEINRSALPVAIRQTLNDAAFDVKKTTMPHQAERFVKRTPTFFKANSKVNPAIGFDVNKMEATVGFIPKASDKSHSVEDLEEQDMGGDIRGRAMIAAPAARSGGSWNKNVRVKNRLANIRKHLFLSDMHNNNLSKTKGKESWVISAIYAGVGGFVMNQDHTRIAEIKKLIKKDGKTIVKSVVVENVEKGRKAHIKPTHFMHKASILSANKMDAYFIKNAEKRIARIK